MPIYEYQCEVCDHKLEKLQKISDDPLKTCPECSAPELTKLVSAAAFRLKGSGWYETDFKNSKKKNATGGEAASSSSSNSDDSDSSGSSSSSSSSGESPGDSSKSTAAS